MSNEDGDRRCGLSEVISPTTCVGQPLSGGESAQGTGSASVEGSSPSPFAEASPRQKWLASEVSRLGLIRMEDVRVKPLEWEAFDGEGEPAEWYARTPCGTFYIETDGDRFSMYSSKSLNGVQHFSFKEDAEASAQADFEARIRSALIVQNDQASPTERMRQALIAIRDGYGPDHLSTFARDIAAAALPSPTASPIPR